MTRRKKRIVSRYDHGNVIVLKNGKYRLDYMTADGRRHRPSFVTRDEAETALRIFHAQSLNDTSRWPS